jgi:hypothetical protein
MGRRTALGCVLGLIGVFRPGIDLLDSWLVRSCWSVPSLWNAVAEVAVRRGAVDPDLGGRRAPFRRASVLPGTPSRLAVVVVSDLRRSRIAIVDEGYRVLGAFERATTNPDLVTDQTRGYMPLSHLWPVGDWYGDGRLETLVALAPTYSEPLAQNVFALLALGPEGNELLFACRLQGKRYPGEVVLERADLDGDGFPDLAIHAYAARTKGAAEPPPWAVFRWDGAARAFTGQLREGAAAVLSCWHATPAARVFFGRAEPLEERVLQLVDLGRAG